MPARKHQIILLLAMLICGIVGVRAQDGLNLPTELYVLLNEGRVQRFGIGSSGVQFITPEGAFVLDFGVAPDGNWLAYRTQSGLFIRDTYADDPASTERQIEGASASAPTTRGRGETIAWSPTSDALAYTTLTGGRVHFLETGGFVDLATPLLQNLLWSPDGGYLAAEANDNIWWVFRREAGNMVLTSAIPGAFGVAWLNSTNLIFAPTSGGLIRMDLADANQQTPIREDAASYHLPYVQADGTLLVYRSTPDADSAERSGRLLQLPVDGSAQPVELGTGDVAVDNLRWAPDSSLLVAFRGGALALLDPLSGAGFTLPIGSASAYGWGAPYPNAVVSVPLPADVYFLARGENGATQVWRLDENSSPPNALTNAELDITHYAVSPDETRLAYVSNSGLWYDDLEDDNSAIELVTLGLSAVQPAFGPDNATIYYRDEQGTNAGIWRISAPDGQPELLLADTADVRYRSVQPATSVSAALVQATLADGANGLLLVDTVSGERNLLGDFERGQWLTGTDVMVLGTVQREAASVRGLHIIDVNNLEEPPLTVLPLADGVRLLDVVRLNNGTLRALIQSRTPGQIRIVDAPESGGEPQVIGNAGYLIAPRLAPDGERVAGLMHPDGIALFYNPTNNARVALSTPDQIGGLRWR